MIKPSLQTWCNLHSSRAFTKLIFSVRTGAYQGVRNVRVFFGKFGVLCFLVTSVLRCAFLPYYQQTVLHTRICSLSKISKLRLGALGQTWQKHGMPHCRLIAIKCNLRRKVFQRANQCSYFIWGSFTNRDNVRASTQFRRKRQSWYLKGW